MIIPSFKELVGAILALTFAVLFCCVVQKALESVGNEKAFPNASALVSIFGSILGAILGYYFGTATSAASARRSEVLTTERDRAKGALAEVKALNSAALELMPPETMAAENIDNTAKAKEILRRSLALANDASAP